MIPEIVDIDSNRKPPLSKRWSSVAWVSLPYLIAAMLLLPGFLALPCEILLRLKVDHFSFRLSSWDSSGLFNLAAASPMRFSGFQKVAWDTASFALPAGVPKMTNLPATFTAANAAATLRFSKAALQSFPLPADTNVSLTWSESEPSRIRVAAQLPQTESPVYARLVVDSNSTVSCSGCGTTTVAILARRQAILTVAPDHSNANFSLQATDDLLKESNLPLLPGSNIAFLRADGNTFLSPVIGDAGKLTLPSVNREIPIHNGQILAIDNIEWGSIRQLEVKEGINLILHAKVGGLRLGSTAQSLREIRPSLLETVAARKDFASFFSVAGLIGTTLLAIFTRLKFVEKDK